MIPYKFRCCRVCNSYMKNYHTTTLKQHPINMEYDILYLCGSRLITTTDERYISFEYTKDCNLKHQQLLINLVLI